MLTRLRRLPSRPDRRGWVRRLAAYLLRHRRSLVITLAAALLGMVAQATVPLVMQAVVDDSILAASRPLAPLLGLLIGLGALRFVLSFVRRFFGAQVGVRIDYDLRNDIYDHLHRLDFTRHDEMETGQLVSRANTDVQVLQRLLTFLPILTSNVLLLPVSLVFMVRLSPPLAAVSAVTAPAFLWLTLKLRKVVYPSAWDASQKEAVVAGVVDDAVSGVRIVKAFGQQTRELERLIDAAGALYGSRLRNIRLSAVRQATLLTVPAMGQVATLALGGWLALRGQLTVGELLAFFAYLTQLVAPIGMMAMMLVMAQMARASAERVLEILDSTPAVVDAPDAMDLDTLRGEILFHNATFGYLRSEPVLRGLDVHIAPGETVAIVGRSGSGKSTAALLVPRFYDVQEGSVLIDGCDVRDVTTESLRRQVGVVFEDSFLFSDTIRSNIAYGHPDATQEEVEAAARQAEAHAFISALPHGYDTVVGERGLSLSGGQRQRIALARALITRPRILILDDATSSIDVRVEEGIHRTLRRVMRGRTTILVAHRRSTLDLADRVVVLDGGRVVDEGSPADLLARSAHFRALFATDGDEESPDRSSAAPARAPGGVRRPDAAEGVRRERAAALAGNRMGLPPAELEAAIAALPSADARPEVDPAAAAGDRSPLTLRGLLRPFAGALTSGLVLVSLDAVLRLAGPWFVRWGVDRGVIGGDPAGLWTAVGGFAAVSLLGRSLRWFATLHTGRTAQRILFWMRVRVFAHLQRLGIDFYDNEMTGRIVTRMTSDINALSALMDTGIVQGVVQVVTFAGTFAILASMDLRLTAVVLLVAPPLAVATAMYRRRSSVAYTRVRDGVASVNARFQESVSGMRVAKAFGREDRNMSGYRDVTGQYLDARLDSQRLSSVYFPFVEMVSVIATVLVLGVGATRVRDGSLTPGELVAFSLYVTTVFAPLQQLSGLFDTYQQARAALEKLRQLLATPVSAAAPEAPVARSPLRGDLSMHDVAFGYSGAPDTPVLQGLNLSIPAGQSVAIVGETGAGKSTIIKLFARFYDPQAGHVAVDGVPLTDLDPADYHRQLAYVPQEAFLFRGSILDNIRYGQPEASERQVRCAARRVGAHDFIESLPDGYLTPVGERGRSLSAGGRQLVALARAALVEPVVLLLDEATASLDLATEDQVNRALTAASTGRTSVLVAHRIPTAHRCDRVLVVDGGRIVEDGPPAALLATGGRYAEMFNLHEAAAVRDIAASPRRGAALRRPPVVGKGGWA